MQTNKNIRLNNLEEFFNDFKRACEMIEENDPNAKRRLQTKQKLENDNLHYHMM